MYSSVDVLFEILMSNMGNNDLDKASTGIAGLDKILRGGLPRSRIYLFEGNPGTGKTTLGLQFLLEGARNGEKGLYITLSETREELTAVARSHGWSLDSLTICDLTISENSLHDDSHYTVFHPSEVELDETTQAVLKEVERVKPSRVVFDSLSEMRLLARDALRYRRQILALKQYFMGKKCTVLLLDDHTSEESDRQLESIAHGVINLEYIPPEYGKQRHRLRILKMRGVNFQSGYHDFNIETGGLTVFERLTATEHEGEHKTGGLSSDIPELEHLLGALDYGTSTMILGPAGIGKSTLALMYACTAADRGERAALYMFDESLSNMYARTSALGLDIKGHVEAGRITARQIDPAELSPGEFTHLVCREVEDNNARVIIIDSLNGYLMATPEERFLTMQFHELLSYLNRKSVVTLLIMAQYGLVGNMETPVDLSYMADTVVLLRYFEAGGEVRQAISVVKKRTGKHERTIREFRIDSGGIHLGGPLTDFRGILTGVPTYEGKREKLMEEDDGDAKG
jgi:circadian clock protein KaiC